MRTACALELWQEAYRSIEDIHALLQLSKKSPKPHLMATYFEKLAQIFWVSGHHLFHAYALFRFYTFSMAAQASIGNAVAAGTDEPPAVGSFVLFFSNNIPCLRFSFFPTPLFCRSVFILFTASSPQRKALATRVLLAALVVPHRNSSASSTSIAGDDAEEITEQKNLRLANLLGFTAAPSRARLLRELLDVHGLLNEVRFPMMF